MLIYFDDNNFMEDLAKLVAGCDRWDKPIVVMPTEKDVRIAEKEFADSHVTFITYDYWLSKKWIADDDYEHIDFFRIDQFFANKCYGVRAGAATMRRTKRKKIEENVEISEEMKGEEE